MKTCFVLAIALFLSTIRLTAQDLEAAAVGGTGLDSAFFSTDVDRNDRSTFLGYNWLSVSDSAIGKRIHANIWHMDDPFLTSGWIDGVKRNMIPGMHLIVNVDSIGITLQNGWGHLKTTVPTQSFAMEYQPWLDHAYNAIQAKDTFSLQSDDSSGGIYGFYERAGGAVEKSTDDGNYRYTLDPATLTSDTAFVALDSVCLDNEFTQWFDKPDLLKTPYNTYEMWFSINLRRLADSSDVGHEDDPVLEITLPFRHVGDSTGGLIAFRARPVSAGTRTVITSSLGRNMGYEVDTVRTITAPTTLVITRRMLPQFTDADDQDVTINAMFLCDRDPDAATPDPPYNNPQIRWTRSDKDSSRIERLGIQVKYYPSVPIGIRWCRLQTTNAKDLFNGRWDRQMRNGMKKFLDSLHVFNNTVMAPLHAGSANRLKLWRIYNRDEVESHLWKAYRYIDRVLHRMTSMEWGLGDAAAAVHCMQPNEFWLSTTQLHPYHAAPFIKTGHTNYAGDPKDYANLKRGRSNSEGYETHISGQDPDLPPPGFVSYTKSLPLSDDTAEVFLRDGIGRHSGSTLQCYEDFLRLCYRQQSFLFDTTRPFLANVWSYSLINVTVKPEFTAMFGNNGRGKSAGEERYACMSPIVLGAKGLLHFGGVSDHPFPVDSNAWDHHPNPLIDTITNWEQGRFQCLMRDSSENIRVASTADFRIDDDSLGADYIVAGDPMNVSQYMYNGLSSVATNLNGGVSDNKIYFGQKTMRQVVRETHDLIAANATTIKSLHMIGWQARGFRNWLAGDSTTYREFLSDDTNRLRVRKPYLINAQSKPAKEKLDSTFFDITLHRKQGAAMDSVFYVMVQNRRTNDLTGVSDSLGTFWTWSQWKAHIDSVPADRYQQRGSREITIPFNYQSGDGRYKLLRVKELSYLGDTLAIDTVVGGDSPLALNYMPGQGRIFEVRPMPSDTTLDGVGYLAYNTQTKIVAWPVTLYDGSGVAAGLSTDSIRYHMVYFKKDPDVNYLYHDTWRVFYRRSVPYRREYLTDNPSVGGITWEPTEYRLSRKTIRNGVAWKHTGGTVVKWAGGDFETESLCCGFPSIVIRPTSSTVSKVYVVYGCRNDYPGENPDDFVHIVENVFTDQPILNPTAIEDGGVVIVSEQPDATLADTCSDAGSLGLLPTVGVPVINASQLWNYYAWSNGGSSIGVGRKFSTQGAFTYVTYPAAPQTIHHLDWITSGVTYQPNLFPSLHTYSNIRLQQDTCSLVWQSGRHIKYTRLGNPTTLNIDHSVPPQAQMLYAIGTVPAFPKDAADANSYIVSDTTPGTISSMPTIMRTLEPDTMRLAWKRGSTWKLHDYHNEQIAWQEYRPAVPGGGSRSDMRYAKLLITSTFGGLDSLHNWYLGRTYYDDSSAMFPVMTVGRVTYASAVVNLLDMGLATLDSMKLLRGNINDTSHLAGFTIMPRAEYQTYKDTCRTEWWKGGLFDDRTQIMQITANLLPVSPHTERAVTTRGQWPHFSQRSQTESPTDTTPPIKQITTGGVNSVRRIFQDEPYTTPPNITVSAEQFYKTSAGDIELQHFACFRSNTSDSAIVLRVICDGYRTLDFAPLVPDTLEGLNRLAYLLGSQVDNLITPWFPVGDEGTLDLELVGVQPEGTRLVVESEADVAADTFSAIVEYPESDNEETSVTSSTVLVNGGNTMYRLRLLNDRPYTSDTTEDGEPASWLKFEEVTRIGGGGSSLEKSARTINRIIDLASGRQGAVNAGIPAISLYPNPSHDVLHVGLDGFCMMTGLKARRSDVIVDDVQFEIHDAAGQLVGVFKGFALGVSNLDVSQLTTGVYTLTAQCGAAFAAKTFAVMR